jgi:hypothetical protein
VGVGFRAEEQEPQDGRGAARLVGGLNGTWGVSLSRCTRIVVPRGHRLEGCFWLRLAAGALAGVTEEERGSLTGFGCGGFG